jgi:site-specific DNA-methyltransferase (adenine-specific)/modification methylase
MEINKIFNEDCLITMNNIENNTVDAVITSPPYNIIRPNSTDRGYDLYKDGMSNAEYMKWTIDIFNGFNNILKKDGVVLYNMSYGTENTTLMSLTIADIINKTNFTLADIIVWKKKNATPNNVSHNKMTRIVEFVYVFCRKDEINTFTCNKKELKKRDTGQAIYENVFNFISTENNDQSTDMNKATFSTKFVRTLMMMYIKPNSLIYDPFMGTGTTANACIIEKHNFLGSEISKKQVEYANKRIELKKMQKTLF